MIREEKMGNALYALNAVLVVARQYALTSRTAAETAGILDTAEHLPRLMAEAEDRTDIFRAHLVTLAGKHVELGLALDRFDRPLPPRW